MDEEGERRDGKVERTTVSTSVDNLLVEARILLPGTQTLFGFELVVVFNNPSSALQRTESAFRFAGSITEFPPGHGPSATPPLP